VAVALVATSHGSFRAESVSAQHEPAPSRVPGVVVKAEVPVELGWMSYQRLIAVYVHNDRRRGKAITTTLIETLRSAVPDALEELAQLGRTPGRGRSDVPAHFDHHAASGPTATSPTTESAEPVARCISRSRSFALTRK